MLHYWPAIRLAHQTLYLLSLTLTLTNFAQGKLKEAVSELAGEFRDQKVKSISADVSKPSIKAALEEASNRCTSHVTNMSLLIYL